MAIETPARPPFAVAHPPVADRTAADRSVADRSVADRTVADRTAGTSLTVLYDADCPVCCETIRHLRRWDRDDRLEFLPLQMAAASGRPILARLATEGHLGDEIHVVNEATGQVVAGGHAALALLDALPGGWLLRPWAALPPTAVAAEVVYRVASRHRDRVAWLMGMRNEVSCPVGPRAVSEREES